MLGGLVLAGALLAVLLGGPILRGKSARLRKYREGAAAFTAVGEFAKAVSLYERALALSPEDSDLRKLLARSRLQSGDLPESIAEYRRSLRGNPEDTQTRLTLAALHLLARNIERSSEILDAVLEKEPDNLLALAMEAQCHYLRKSGSHPVVYVDTVTDILPPTASPYNLPTGAGTLGVTPGDENTLLQAVKDSPDEVQPHKNLADFYRRQKRFAEAEGEYRKMVEIAPRDAYVYLHLADFYRGKEIGQLLKAIEQYSHILRSIDGNNLFALRGISGLSIATDELAAAKRYVERLLWEHPSDAYGRYFRGILSVYDGHTERAERDFLFVTREVSEYAPAHYLLGYTYLVNHAMQTAEKSLEQAARVDPAYGCPRLLVAEIALNREEHKAALEAINRLLIVEKEKEDPLVHVMEGRVYVSQNDPTLAEAPLARLGEVDKESVYPKLLLAEVYKRTGKSDAAVAQYEGAIAADPASARPLYLLGLLYERMGDPVLAMSNYVKAVKKAPNLAVAARSVAEAYVRNSGGNQADARALGETFLKEFPNNFTVLDTLGTVFYERKEFDKAVEVLELIPEQERDARPQIVYHYAMALYASSRKAQAESERESEKVAQEAAQKAARRKAHARRELEKAIRWLRTLPSPKNLEETLDEIMGAGGISG